MIHFTKKNLSKLNNIGDVLCTPDNYFEIASDRNITIVGGGVWNIEKIQSPNTVAWAVGRSIRYPKSSNKLPNTNFLAAGFRDYLDLNDTKLFLPCVSCLNSNIAKEPAGNKTLVFTNANIQVSHKIIKSHQDRIYLTNDCSVDEFMDAWQQSDKVITNSYHGIYWSLLSGRSVAPYGYSSKFTNVSALFNIEFPRKNLYDVTNRTTLDRLINQNNHKFFKSNRQFALEHFQELNLKFAKSLERMDIVCNQKFP